MRRHFRSPERRLAAGRSVGDVPFPGIPIDGGGSNIGYSGLPTVPFGGELSTGVGGYIDVYNAGEGPIGTGPDDDSPDPAQVSIDVASWRVRKIFEYATLACSGNLGATDRRLIGYNYQWQAELLWDYRRPADSMGVFRSSAGLELVFWLGAIMSQQMRKVYFPGLPIVYPFLWCPDAVMEVGETTLDALRKKMTRVPCQGSTRSHLFTCPAEGMPSDPTTRAGAYSQFWENR